MCDKSFLHSISVYCKLEFFRKTKIDNYYVLYIKFKHDVKGERIDNIFESSDQYSAGTETGIC